jgi:response regulator RpfG family c-di-GMP phosphodiesterase
LSAIKRIQQGIHALLAFSRTVDYELAERYLNTEQIALFRRLAKSEQLHSLNVLRDVLAQEEQTAHELTIAALLHDVGKARYHLAIWQKTISVLVTNFLPELDAKLIVEEELNFWRAPFLVREHHPKWGGQYLAEIGASEQVIWLVTHHADSAKLWQDHPLHSLLLRLQLADNAN